MAKHASLHLRLSEEERGEIERRAAAAGMTMTAYVIAAALGGLPATERLDQIAAALERIESRLTDADH